MRATGPYWRPWSGRRSPGSRARSVRTCQCLRPRRVRRARAGAPVSFAFHNRDSVGTQDTIAIAAQWLACTFPYRRFADTLAAACARLGADVARYTFIAVDLHHFLLAGLPAHPKTISRFGGAGRARCGVAPHLCGSPHGARSALHRIPPSAPKTGTYSGPTPKFVGVGRA